MSKIVVVTGASSGIGKAVAKMLLEQKFDVIGVGASERALATEEELRLAFPDQRIRFFRADLSKMQSVRELSLSIKNQLTLWNAFSLHALVNNAGGVVGKYMLTEDGFEYQFALNHLSTLLMAYELKDVLSEGMILFTGSKSHYQAKIRWNDMFYKRFYWIFGPYRQSKLANLMTAVALNKRWIEQSIRSYVVDPGLVKTNIGTRTMKGIGKLAWLYVSRRGILPEEAAKTYLHLIIHRPSQGLYFRDSMAVTYNKVADDVAQVERLYKHSCGMLGIHDES